MSRESLADRCACVRECVCLASPGGRLASGVRTGGARAMIGGKDGCGGARSFATSRFAVKNVSVVAFRLDRL